MAKWLYICSILKVNANENQDTEIDRINSRIIV
jgi:hypothetical protein